MEVPCHEVVDMLRSWTDEFIEDFVEKNPDINIEVDVSAVIIDFLLYIENKFENHE